MLFRSPQNPKTPCLAKCDLNFTIYNDFQTAGFLWRYGKLLGSAPPIAPFSIIRLTIGWGYSQPLASYIWRFASFSKITLIDSLLCTPRSLALSLRTSEAILEAILSSAVSFFFEAVVVLSQSGFSIASFYLASATRTLKLAFEAPLT